MSKTPKHHRYLIIGAGMASQELLIDIKAKASHIEVVGILDDDPLKQNRFLEKVPILGKINSLRKIVKQKKVNVVIICIEKISKQILNKIIDDLTPGSCILKIIPSVYENIKEEITFSMVRNLSAEDLIGRTDIEIDHDFIAKELKGKSIFISGAGGTIGSALCQQLLNYPLKEIICFSRGEHSLYSLKQILENKKHPRIKITYLLGDIRDINALDEVMKQKKPDWVFHAAAHKHVAFMEDNEKEAIKNNIFGTDNILRASYQHGISQFVFISSDKAVNPKNIMGFSKRIGECLVHHYQTLGLSASVVRFGNVIGSRGSVVPLFNRQLSHDGPITVTHPKVERYFMTIPESANLVINAAAEAATLSQDNQNNQDNQGKKRVFTGHHSRNSEKNNLGDQEKTFILDMGKPVKIDELVRRLIKVHGYRLNEDIKISYTGLQSGEKIYEELYGNRDDLELTRNPKIFRVKEKRLNWKVIYQNVQLLKKIIQDITPSQGRQWIKSGIWMNDHSKLTKKSLLSKLSK